MRQRSAVMSAVVDSLSSSLASDMVPGEEEKVLATRRYMPYAAMHSLRMCLMHALMHALCMPYAYPQVYALCMRCMAYAYALMHALMHALCIPAASPMHVMHMHMNMPYACPSAHLMHTLCTPYAHPYACLMHARSFAMMVQSDNPAAFAGKAIGGGAVLCPRDGLSSGALTHVMHTLVHVCSCMSCTAYACVLMHETHSLCMHVPYAYPYAHLYAYARAPCVAGTGQPASAKVVAWADAGPLFWAAGRAPAGPASRRRGCHFDDTPCAISIEHTCVR